MGLNLLKNMGFIKLWIQVDLLVLVGFIQESYNLHLEHAHMIQQCKDKINGLRRVFLISHCYREANKVADRLT